MQYPGQVRVTGHLILGLPLIENGDSLYEYSILERDKKQHTGSEIEFITKLLEHKIHFIGLNIDFFEIKL